MYFLSSLLSIVFSLFSMSMLAPVLQVLFMEGKTSAPVQQPGALDFFARIKNYINDLILDHDKLTALAYVCGAVVIFVLLKNIFLYIAIYLLAPIRNAVLRRLRDDMFVKMLQLPIGYFTQERKGDLVSRMTNDINEVEVSVMSVLESFIREPLTIVVYITAMVIISPQLSLFIFIFLPIAGLVIGRITKALRKDSRLSQTYLGELMGFMDETLGGMRVVKAFNAESHQHLKFTKTNNLLFRVRNRISARRELASPASEVMGVMVVCIILWYGGRLILSGTSSVLSADLFLTYIALFTQVINPFKNLSSAFSNIRKGSAALERIEEVLQTKNTIFNKEQAKILTEFTTGIELKNVNFSYQDKPILKHINLKIPKGKTIALVGASGAGKSTLADLIPRFHDVSSGEILIDGINIKDYQIRSVRQMMGIVAQDPILFNDTIANNIALGSGHPSEEKILQAAISANAIDIIRKKPEGLQAEVGDRGNRLSGGERQRITIARALLKNPPILILDEATSSLDTESERIVQEAINELMKNRTVLVIAHRLSTVRNADEIIVLDQGEIAERGTHHFLIQQNGIYQKLVAMQEVK